MNEKSSSHDASILVTRSELNDKVLALLQQFATNHLETPEPKVFDDMLWALCQNIATIKSIMKKHCELPDHVFWRVMETLVEAAEAETPQAMN